MPRLGDISPITAFLLSAGGVPAPRIRQHRAHEFAIDLCKPCVELVDLDFDPDTTTTDHPPYSEGMLVHNTPCTCTMCGAVLTDADE